MNDTVRDAVFGNVGTTISFRVSADDAPILSKQFEPNFEAADILQMHNRNFIINMVIGGEKVPAFSAKTLELPPTQADNTSLIIENSRRMYSRNRSEVEQAISAVIMPPQRPATPQAQHKPTLQPAQKTGDIKQPANASQTPAVPTTPGSATSDQPKKKRSRSRRKKTDQPNTTAPDNTTANHSKSKTKDLTEFKIER